jgi:hypothetical protein
MAAGFSGSCEMVGEVVFEHRGDCQTRPNTHAKGRFTTDEYHSLSRTKGDCKDHVSAAPNPAPFFGFDRSGYSDI